MKQWVFTQIIPFFELELPRPYDLVDELLQLYSMCQDIHLKVQKKYTKHQIYGSLFLEYSFVLIYSYNLPIL